MANTTTWAIANLDRKVATGEISTVHFTVRSVSEDGVYSASAYGSIALDPADPEAMVPYSEVTQEQALQWLHAKLGEETIASTIEALDNQIAEQRQPTVAQGVPWAA